MNYPEKILRGISDPSWIDADGFVSAAAFQFTPTPNRSDSFEEASINWYDDEGALSFLINKRKENTDAIQFKGGVAILSKRYIDTLLSKPAGKGNLSYERRALEDNSYHGNLLRLTTASKQIKSTISAALAMGVDEVIPAN